jgi:hypothetical protein
LARTPAIALGIGVKGLLNGHISGANRHSR